MRGKYLVITIQVAKPLMGGKMKRFNNFNITLLAQLERRKLFADCRYKVLHKVPCGVEQMEARQPHKLMVVGSSPTSRYQILFCGKSTMPRVS